MDRFLSNQGRKCRYLQVDKIYHCHHILDHERMYYCSWSTVKKEPTETKAWMLWRWSLFHQEHLNILGKSNEKWYARRILMGVETRNIFWGDSELFDTQYSVFRHIQFLEPHGKHRQLTEYIQSWSVFVHIETVKVKVEQTRSTSSDVSFLRGRIRHRLNR